MRKNQNVLIKGEKVVLVPYEEHHVKKYNDWMQSKELQELTASEPLTLEQEYEMQKSWREDEKKCTFIILENNNTEITAKTETESMIGDVNIFFNEEEDEKTGEIEIMIAESSARGKGCGKEALLMMMRYGIEELGMNRFTAKIGMENKPSLMMFEKIGFHEISRSDVFKEITFELTVIDSVVTTLNDHTREYKMTHVNFRFNLVVVHFKIYMNWRQLKISPNVVLQTPRGTQGFHNSSPFGSVFNHIKVKGLLPQAVV